VKRWNERNPDNPVLLIMMGAEAAQLTKKDCHFYAFRTSTNADMRVKALVKALSENNRLGPICTSCCDSCSNYSQARDFRKDLGSYT
jgi:branched-chain amino acid transport system substrate-binding protein